MIATQTKQHQVGSELNSDMTDVIHEWVPMCLSIQIRQFKRLDNPSQRRRSYNQVKNKQNCRVSSNHKIGKKTYNVPPFESFSMEKLILLISCQNDQHIEAIIFCKLDHFWAALWTKKIFPSQNRDFENGVIVKISKS